MDKYENKLNEKIIYDRLNIKAQVTVLEQTTSTNDIAKEAITNNAPNGSVVVANAQTQGRGRRGRSFFSPADSGVYFSVILYPSVSPENSVLVTSAAAVAVCESIELLTHNNAQIKWLNDICINEKKCAGILVESVFLPDGRYGVVVGIGINITTASFPDEFSARAGIVGEVNKNELVSEIVNRLTLLCDKLEKRDYLSEYKRRCFVLGREITVIDAGGQYAAVAEDLDELARLVVTKGKEKILLYNEEVTTRI